MMSNESVKRLKTLIILLIATSLALAMSVNILAIYFFGKYGVLVVLFSISLILIAAYVCFIQKAKGAENVFDSKKE